jgi:NitT/TauT family transport system ATP-binding protein
VDTLYTLMTNPELAISAELGDVDSSAATSLLVAAAHAVPTAVEATPLAAPISPFARPLPHVRLGGVSGLLELIAEQGDGRRDLPNLAERLQLEVDDLLPLLDAAVLLGFAEVTDGDVVLTPIGRDFATTTILRSKDLFRQQALARIPVMASIVHTLQQKANGSMRAEFFLGIWDDYFPIEEAERQLTTAVDWGRYGELFEFDAVEGRLSLPS